MNVLSSVPIRIRGNAMPNLSAADVADYLLAQMCEECGDTISNLKLQKLLYYAQGFSLAETGKPLFPEPIKAWQHGPVVPSVYGNYKTHGSGSIPKPQGVSFDKFSEAERSLLDEVYKVFGQFSAWKLRNMTHEEPPWRTTPRDETIDHGKLRDYFKTRLT